MTAAGRPAIGVVAIAALDVRRAPDHASEMGSQLLMGELVRVIRRGAGDRWFRVESLTDHYLGWVRAWGLVLPPPRGRAGWHRWARGRPRSLRIEVREGPGSGPIVSPLLWGSRVIPGRVAGRYRQIELPDGVRGWVLTTGLAVGARGAPPLRQRVRDLMGVPYLWGGRTPAGLDCSGLAQLLLAEQGFPLPRDAGEQERSCRRLGPEQRVRTGDLAFFGPRGRPASHVGVMLGPGIYAHARGRVRLNALDPSNPLFDNELSAQFRGFGRPLRRASPVA